MRRVLHRCAKTAANERMPTCTAQFFANSSLLFPRYWMAQLSLFFLPSGIAKQRKCYRGWFLPTTLYKRALKENHLDATGIKPRSLAPFPPQATALSIAPWPSRAALPSLTEGPSYFERSWRKKGHGFISWRFMIFYGKKIYRAIKQKLLEYV